MLDNITLLWNLMSFENSQFIADIFWYAGLLILVIWMSIRDDIKSMKVVTIALVFWTCNYVLLWLDTAVIASMIWFARMYFSFHFKWSMPAFYFTAVLTLVFWIYTFEWIISSLPILASIFAIISFQLLSGIKMRWMLFLCSILRLVYMLHVQNIPWIINEMIMLCIIGTTIYKMYLLHWESISVKQLLRNFIHKKRWLIRQRIDFERFIVFRDRKRYLSDDFSHVYEWDSSDLKSTL